MKTLLAILSILVVGIVAFFAYALDQWLGIAAFTGRYIAFSAMLALLVAASWLAFLKKGAIGIAFTVFAILAGIILLPPPSERILRTALLRIPAGTHASEIERIVKEEYEGSGYALPGITEEPNRIHISLLSQEPGNCTAITFETKDGVVVSGHFMAD